MGPLPPKPYRGTRGGQRDKARAMSFGLLQGMGSDTWNMRRQPAFQVINATLHTTQQHMHLYQAESSAAL